MPRKLTIFQAANRLGVSRTTIERAIKSYSLPAESGTNGRKSIQLADLENWRMETRMYTRKPVAKAKKAGA